VGGNNSNIVAGPFSYTALLSVSAIPEPESVALMLAGLSFIGWQMRRTNKA